MLIPGCRTQQLKELQRKSELSKQRKEHEAAMGRGMQQTR